MKDSLRKNLTPLRKSILVFSFLTLIYILLPILSINASTSLDYPIVPQRPTLRQLYLSLLNIPIYKYEKSKTMIKKDVSLFDLDKKNNDNFEVNEILIDKNYLSGFLVDSYEKSYMLGSETLLMNSLDSALELKLALKYLDVDEKKIIVVDNMQNALLINILNDNNDTSLVKILGYSPKSDNISVNGVVEKLATLISEKTKK
jgi:hypothetical protein